MIVGVDPSLRSCLLCCGSRRLHHTLLPGETLWDIIGGSASLSALIDGRELHQQFVTAASNGGRWVAYPWKNKPDEPTYLKIAYVARVTRGERSFYLGVGLGDHNWDQPASEAWVSEGGGTSRWSWGCSVHRQHPCSEDWAVAVAGRSMAAMLTAPNHTALQATLNAGIGRFGFAAHVHNSTQVLFDGHDASFQGESPVSWLSEVGLSDAVLVDSPSGSWLGPFNIRLKRGGSRAPRYLLVISVPIEDKLADGVVDGVGEVFTILVAVSAAAPMLTPAQPAALLSTSAPSSLMASSLDGSGLDEGSGLECLQRPSAWGGTSAFKLTDRIKCVSNWSEIGSSPSHCSDATAQGVCPISQNAWSDGSFDLDLGCIELEVPSTGGLAADGIGGGNATFCGCKLGFDVRFASGRILGDFRAPNATTLDPAALPPDAQCAAPEHACAPGDLPCATNLKLQWTYEQYCALATAPVADPPFPVVAVTAASVLGILLAGAFVAYAAKRMVKMRRRYRYREQLRLQAIIDALESTSELRHPFVFVPADTFIAGGKLVPFEKLRDEGALRFFDSLDSLKSNPKRVIFFSHRECRELRLVLKSLLRPPQSCSVMFHQLTATRSIDCVACARFGRVEGHRGT